MLLDILFNYLVPIIYSSFIGTILSFLIIYIFRIRDSNIRILFFFLPLIKPFIVLIERVDINDYFFNNRTGVLGLRFPSPNMIVNSTELIRKSPIQISDFNYFLIITIISVILLIILLRLIGLYFFYRRLAFAEIIKKNEAPYLLENISFLSNKLKINTPRVSFTSKKINSPFVIGVIKNVLVFPSYLFAHLSSSELITILAHELSHLKRKDNIITWIAILFRDLLFFNPFVYFTYYLIRLEQEKGSDRLLIGNIGLNKKQVANDILKVLIKIKDFDKKDKQNSHFFGNSFIGGYLSNISLKIRIRSIIYLNPNIINMNLYLKILMIILFIIALLVQLAIVVKIGDTYIFLR